MKEENESGNGKKFLSIGKNEAGIRSNHKKGRAMIMTLIMLFAVFVSLSALIPAASAQSQIPSYYGWAGYEGNQSIYLTSFLTNTNQMFFSASSLGSLAVQPSGNGNLNNAVAVGVGGSASTPNGNTVAYEEYYVASPNNQMVINIPVTAVGSSNWTYSVSGNEGSSSTSLSGIDYEQLSVNIPTAYPSAIATPYTGYTDGINVSSTYVVGTNFSQFEWNTAWYLLGLLPDGFGQVISTANYEHSLYGVLQNNPNSQYLGTGNDTNGKFGMDIMKTQTGSTLAYKYGYDTYGVTTVYQLTINSRDFLNASKLVIGADNIEQTNSNGLVTTSKGAYSSVPINVTPAYTIQGTAYINGQKATNHELLLETSSANYYIWTNETGQYRFFAQPGVNYFLTSSSANIGGVQIDPSATDTSGGNYNLYITTATFSESGLSGQSWSVKLAGPLLPSGNQEYFTSSSTGSSITFSVAGDESYQYSVGVPTGYTVSSSSGFVDVATAPYSMSVTFTKTPTYTVTITESGLPSGTLWSAKLGGTTASSTSSSISFYSVPDGTYSWSVPYVYYSTTLWYEPSPGSGTITVNGNSASVSTTFYGVPQSTTSCVYALAPVFLANHTFQYAEDINVGESIMTYNFTSNTMESGTVQAVYVTQHSDMFVINGYLKVANDQDIWTNHGYIQAQNLTSNDTIFDVFDHQFYKVHSISVETGNFTMYDFYVSENHNYIVWSNLMQDRLP